MDCSLEERGQFVGGDAVHVAREVEVGEASADGIGAEDFPPPVLELSVFFVYIIEKWQCHRWQVGFQPFEI